MKAIHGLVLGVAAAAVSVGAVLAQGELNPAVKARQAQMTLQTFYGGTLFGMAQGKVPYDAAIAKTAAEDLATIVQTDWTPLFPAGTAVGETDGTNALPAIWSDMDGFNAKHADLVTAVKALPEAAGKDLDSLKAAVGAVGGACGACHKAYRQAN